MSDFPRGWTLSSQPAIGVVASIVVPAVSGVVHVLDAVTCKANNLSAAATAPTVVLSSSDGVFASFPLIYLAIPAAAADSGSLSGLDLAAGPGASLTVAFNVGVANVFEVLLIQGHDI